MSSIDPLLGPALIRVARDAINAYLCGTKPKEDNEVPSGLNHSGVFVTLRCDGALRGCIGTFSDEGELVDVIRSMAVAALRDPRFTETPVSASELADIRIELSILAPLERIDDPLNFERGTHGIYVRHERGSGCFLPEVGMELDWDRETFLSQLCAHKAGLGADDWRSPETQVFRFTVTKLVES